MAKSFYSNIARSISRIASTASNPRKREQWLRDNANTDLARKINESVKKNQIKKKKQQDGLRSAIKTAVTKPVSFSGQVSNTNRIKDIRQQALKSANKVALAGQSTVKKAQSKPAQSSNYYFGKTNLTAGRKASDPNTVQNRYASAKERERFYSAKTTIDKFRKSVADNQAMGNDPKKIVRMRGSARPDNKEFKAFNTKLKKEGEKKSKKLAKTLEKDRQKYNKAVEDKQKAISDMSPKAQKAMVYVDPGIDLLIDTGESLIPGVGASKVLKAGKYGKKAVGALKSGSKAIEKTNIAKDINTAKNILTKQPTLTKALAKKGKKALSAGNGLSASIYKTNIGIRSFGSAYNDAKNKGASDSEAGLSGLLHSTSEIATESMWSVAKPLQKITGRGLIRYDGKGLEKMVNKFIKSERGKDVARGLSLVARSANTEGLEEVINQVVQNVGDNFLYKHENMDKDWWQNTGKESFQSYLIGGLYGGLFGGGNVVSNITQNTEQRKRNKDAYNTARQNAENSVNITPVTNMIRNSVLRNRVLNGTANQNATNQSVMARLLTSRQNGQQSLDASEVGEIRTALRNAQEGTPARTREANRNVETMTRKDFNDRIRELEEQQKELGDILANYEQTPDGNYRNLRTQEIAPAEEVEPFAERYDDLQNQIDDALAYTDISEDNNTTLPDDEENIQDNGLASYTQHDLDNWKNSKSVVVYESPKQFNDFIEDALSTNKERSSERIMFGTIPSALAERIQEKTGLNVRGYNVSLSKDEIKKIIKSHGNDTDESKHGQRGITKEDIRKIPEIISNPDEVLLDSEQKYNGRPVLHFIKESNGKVTIITYESGKKHSLIVQTMYSRRPTKKSLATAEDVQAPAFTSETTSGTALSDSNISESEGTVNENTAEETNNEGAPIPDPNSTNEQFERAVEENRQNVGNAMGLWNQNEEAEDIPEELIGKTPEETQINVAVNQYDTMVRPKNVRGRDDFAENTFDSDIREAYQSYQKGATDEAVKEKIREAYLSQPQKFDAQTAEQQQEVRRALSNLRASETNIDAIKEVGGETNLRLALSNLGIMAPTKSGRYGPPSDIENIYAETFEGRNDYNTALNVNAPITVQDKLRALIKFRDADVVTTVEDEFRNYNDSESEAFIDEVVDNIFSRFQTARTEAERLSDEEVRQEMAEAREHGTFDGGTPRVVNDAEIKQTADGILNRDDPEEFKLEVQRDILAGNYNKPSWKIQDSIEQGIKAVDKNPEKEIRAILDLRDSDYIPKDAYNTIAKGEYLLRLTREQGNTRLYADIAEALAEVTSSAGSTLRASRLLREATPEGRLRVLEKIKKRMETKYAKQLKGKSIEIAPETARRIKEAGSEQELNEAMYDAQLELYNQTPATFKEKLDAIRMLAMLGNPKTHIRNIVGNAIFMPVRAVKNAVLAGAEKVTQNAGVINQEDRSTTFLTKNAQDKELVDFARRDFKLNEKRIRGEERYTKETTDRPMEGNIFGIEAGTGVVNNPVYRLLNKVAKANGGALNKEDIAFMKPAYASAFAREMKARGLTPEDMRNNPNLEEEIRAHATQEGLRAVYRDESALASWINDLKRRNQVVGIGVDSIMPFVKTPVNIMRRSLDYSPIGLMYSSVQLAKAYQNLNDAKSKDSEEAMAVAKREFVTQLDRLSAGMTGSMIMGVGFVLAKLGLLSGDLGDDDEAWYRNDLGEQAFSIKLPNGGTYTLDWAVPASIPLFSGCALWEQMKDENVSVSEVLDVIGQTLDPTMEMSVLQGISNSLESITNAKSAGDKAMALVLNTATNYGSQVVPTFSGQLARLVDPVRRNTASTADSQTQRAIERFLNKQKAKIPGLSKTLEPMLDRWGREKVSSPAQRFLENFFSPGYYQSNKRTSLDDEILRLAESTGESSVIPKGLDKNTLTLNSEQQRLSPSDKTNYNRLKGTVSREAVETLINSSVYRRMSDSEKAKAIANLYTDAGANAKRKTLIGMGNDEWKVYSADLSGKRKPDYSQAKRAGFSAEEYFNYVTSKDWDQNNNGRISNVELKTWLNGLDLTGEQKAVLFDKMKYSTKTKNPYGKGVETADVGRSYGGYSRKGRSSRYSGYRRKGSGSSRSTKRTKTDSEKAFTRATSSKLRDNITPVQIKALTENTSGLTKSQKKALLKLLTKRLKV